MKKRKIMSIALVALMAVNSLAMTTAYADVEIAYEDSIVVNPIMVGESSSDNSDVAMKTALTKVKKRVTVPKALTEFTYNTYTNNGVTTYNFYWSNSSDDLESDGTHLYKSLNVTIVGDVINSYYYSDGQNYDWITPKLAKLSDAALLSKAKASLKKIDPTIYSQCEVTSNGVSMHGNTATFKIQRKFNGVKVQNNTGSISVDKNTGEIKSMNISWWENATFKKKANAISETKAIEAYKSLNTLVPYYVVDTDYETGKKTVNIVYSPTFTSEIDAISGKESTMNADRNKMYSNDYGEDVIAETEDCADDSVDIINPATGVSFTPSETKAISENEKLLSRAKVLEILDKDKYINISSDMKCSQANLYEEKNNYTNTSKYYWNMSYSYSGSKSYKSLNVKLDAQTGKILYFSGYSYTQNEKLPVLDVEKANSTAQDVMKYYLPSIYKKYKADESNTKEVSYWGEKEKYYDTSRTFIFNRFENGIQVSDDSIYITVDSNNNVTQFNYSYTDDVKFTKQTILSTEQAYTELFKQQKPELYHNGYVDLKGKAKTYLVYSMGIYTLNAKTGKLCAYNGAEIVENAADIKYTDINGIAAQKAIEELTRHGVTLDTTGGKFQPDMVITEEEFTTLCTKVFNNYEIYYYYINNNTNTKTKAVNDKNLTKTAACKYMVKAMNAEDYAKLKGIYTTPFKDVAANSEDIGYIAICYGKGAIKLDSTAKFNGSKEMTRADAILMLYNYIKAQA